MIPRRLLGITKAQVEIQIRGLYAELYQPGVSQDRREEIGRLITQLRKDATEVK